MILVCLIYLFIAFEEISHIELIKISSIKEINSQNLTNIHNLEYFQPYLKKLFIVVNLFLGWFGWRNLSNIEFLPNKKYCLFFLFCATMYTLEELKQFVSNFAYSLIPFLKNQENFYGYGFIFVYL